MKIFIKTVVAISTILFLQNVASSAEGLSAKGPNTLGQVTLGQIALEQAPRELPFPLVPGAVFESGDTVSHANGLTTQYLRFKTPYDRSQLVQWYRGTLQSEWKLGKTEEDSRFACSFKASNSIYSLRFTFMDHTSGTRNADVSVYVGRNVE